jgi:hypothetical protein
MTLHAENYKCDPSTKAGLAYVKKIIMDTEMTRTDLCVTLGYAADGRMVRHWLAGTKTMPYVTQYCIEQLATCSDA